jgi:hypothetical protein
MVARVNREMFSNALHTPAQDPADSEDVRLALETARVLEAQGDLPDAARWIRRAVDAAEKEGKEARALVLARAASDLTGSIASPKENATAPSSVPTLNVRGRSSAKAPRPEPPSAPRAASLPQSPAPLPSSPPGSIPPMLAALISSIPPFSSRATSTPPPAPAAARPPPSAPPDNDVVSTPADKPLTARTMRIGSIRVAVGGSMLNAKSLFIERLEKGEPVPAGAMEAMLVLTGEIDGSLVMETHLPVAHRTPTKP